MSLCCVTGSAVGAVLGFALGTFVRNNSNKTSRVSQPEQSSKESGHTCCVSQKGHLLPLAGSAEAGFADGVGMSARFNHVNGLTIDVDGNLFVADFGNRSIRKVTPNLNVSTLVGGDAAGFVDGHGMSARVNGPSGMSIDGDGNLCVADVHDHSIRTVTPTGNVSTLAGSGEAGFTDGDGTSARFNEPSDISIDGAGNLFVADRQNHSIRKVTPNGNVSTLAGGGAAGFIDGDGASARFNSPMAISMDGDGNLFVADSENHSIRKVTPSGNVSTLAGNGAAGFIDEHGTNARFNHPLSVSIDSDGSLFVADLGNCSIRKVTPKGGVYTFMVFGSTVHDIVIDAQGSVIVAHPHSMSRVIADQASSMTQGFDMCKIMECTHLADVTFIVGEGKAEIKAHRLILVNRSDYFRKMLTSGFCEGQLGEPIELPHVKPSVFRVVLTFLYTHAFQVDDDLFIDVAQKADEYQLTHLYNRCVQHCQQSIAAHNAIPWLVKSDQYKLKALKAISLEYVCQHLDDIKAGASETIKDLSPLFYEVIMTTP